MKRVTGGGAPAGIWHDFMTAALPRLRVQPIPGSVVQAPPEPDPIGDLVDGVQDFLDPDRDAPPPSAFDEQPRPPPRREDPPF
jgi:penicillin-binding protein 1A